MRFFRIARILNIPDILQFLHILRSSNSIRLTRILCLLSTVWLSAAGFIHLVGQTARLPHTNSSSSFVRSHPGRKLGRLLPELFKLAANHLLPMCLLPHRHHEVWTGSRLLHVRQTCQLVCFLSPF